MKHVTKLVCMTLMLIVAFNPSFGQKDTIELSIDPGTGLLLDPGTTHVFRGDYVFWKIKGGDNLWSFGIAGSNPPFSSPLPSGSNYINIGRTISKQFPFGEWKYTISYTLKTDPHQLLILDPKIAVIPVILSDKKTEGSSTTLYVILAAVAAIVIATLIFFRRKRNSK